MFCCCSKKKCLRNWIRTWIGRKKGQHNLWNVDPRDEGEGKRKREKISEDTNQSIQSALLPGSEPGSLEPGPPPPPIWRLNCSTSSGFCACICCANCWPLFPIFQPEKMERKIRNKGFPLLIPSHSKRTIKRLSSKCTLTLGEETRFHRLLEQPYQHFPSFGSSCVKKKEQQNVKTRSADNAPYEMKNPWLVGNLQLLHAGIREHLLGHAH